VAQLPPLLSERSRGTEFVLLVVVPSVGGAIAGVLLGVNEIAYLVYSALAIAAGFLGGLEHQGGWNGFYRGLVGGMEFGVFILIAHGVGFDSEPKAELPDPEILLVVITTVLGCLLGALGGRRRLALEKRAAAWR
jgi:hypothetical protein